MGSGASDELTTLLSARFDPTPASSDRFVLTVVDGAEKDRAFVVEGSAPGRVLVGSGPACEIRLGDREVSRRHAALDVVGARLRIVDLGSSNGTYVDGVFVVEAHMLGGETVRLGATKLRVMRDPTAAGTSLPMTHRFGKLIGASTEMRRLYPLCARLAESKVPVVIEGETGTGKEVLAESIHEQGPRAAGPFVVFDCTSVPANLMEAELLGHEKGAFTGATSARKGVFELAHGGTLLIDEIGDLESSLQPKLLRVVERGEVRRVGSERSIPVDVRILAATRRNLDAEVQTGRFRDDLFYRLAVTRIELPPLRQRRGDIGVLARYFASELGGSADRLSADIVHRWERDPWPGNVRALRNAVARVLALGELTYTQQASHEPPPTPIPTPSARDPLAETLALGLPFPVARQRVLLAFERAFVDHALATHGGNVTRAAAASGIGRRYLNMIRARLQK
jgi:two-component system, NtrC family, response regulator HydG